MNLSPKITNELSEILVQVLLRRLSADRAEEETCSSPQRKRPQQHH